MLSKYQSNVLNCDDVNDNFIFQIVKQSYESNNS